MQIVRKTSILIALGFAFGAAMAGEIDNTTVTSTNANNSSAGFLASAPRTLACQSRTRRSKTAR